MALPNGWNIALVGASSLKGKEVRSVLEERGFPLGRMLLLDAEEYQGQLTEFDGEPTVLQPVTDETFQGIDLAIFACPPSFAEAHSRQALDSGARVIDLSYSLEGNPQARLVAPFSEIPTTAPSDAASILVPAHPAAVAVGGVLARLARRAHVRHAVTVIHMPVSERGQAAVEELHQQTINLLSFQELQRSVFDAQVAFNTLPEYGAQSRPTLREEQERIQRHVGSLLGNLGVRLAMRVVQAAVFHSYSFLCWVDLEKSLAATELDAELNRKPFSISAPGEASPSVVAAAGSDDILLGPVERDPASETGYWIWGVFDNLRIAALNVQRIAEQMYHAAAHFSSASTAAKS